MAGVLSTNTMSTENIKYEPPSKATSFSHFSNSPSFASCRKLGENKKKNSTCFELDDAVRTV